MHGLGLLLLSVLWLQVVAPRAALPHVEQYEVVRPRRLPGTRTRRALPSHLGLYPESVSYILGARGHNFTLHLRKNRRPAACPSLSTPEVASRGNQVGPRVPQGLFSRDLVGSGYTETYMADNGSQVTEQLQRQDHCFYQGHVEGYQHSAASLSTCAGLREVNRGPEERVDLGTPAALGGFFQAGSAFHLIEPLEVGGEEEQHALYQARHLRQKAGTCGPPDSCVLSENWPLSRETRYVELYVVTDSTEFQQLGSREAVRRRVLEVVNHVDKDVRVHSRPGSPQPNRNPDCGELNFRVVLVGLEIWNSGDKIHISSQANTTLENFLAWRARELAGHRPHDNAQLITGIDFTGTTVGLAKVSAMCFQDSGAVNQGGRVDGPCERPQPARPCLQDHSPNPIGVASTMAHEMGHNLGMDHDENVQGCYCPVPRSDGGCIMAASIGSKFPRKFSQCSQTDLETFVEKPRTACLVNPPDLSRLVGGPVCGNRFVEHGEQCDCGSPQHRGAGSPSPSQGDCQNHCCNATTCLLAEGAECAHGACCHECRVKPAGEPCRPEKDLCDLGEYCDGQQPACPEDAFQENGTPCPGGYCYNGNCPTLAQRCQDLWGPGTQVAAEMCYTYSISPGCRSRIPLGSDRTPVRAALVGGVNMCGTLLCEGGQKPLERGSCTIYSRMGACQALHQDDSTAYELVPEGARCGEEKVCNHKDQCHCHPGWAPPYCAELLSDVRTASSSFQMGVLVPVVLLVALALTVAGVVIYRKGWSPVRKRPTASVVTPKRPPPAVSICHPQRAPQASPKSHARFLRASTAAMSSPLCPVPVYTQQAPDQPRPAPPAKPLPALKPKQGPAGEPWQHLDPQLQQLLEEKEQALAVLQEMVKGRRRFNLTPPESAAICKASFGRCGGGGVLGTAWPWTTCDSRCSVRCPPRPLCGINAVHGRLRQSSGTWTRTLLCAPRLHSPCRPLRTRTPRLTSLSPRTPRTPHGPSRDLQHAARCSFFLCIYFFEGRA
ncbi:disintegrin and metalloproteinase domain-containing protein 8 [Camelus ferus]|nr:disintegrin and metalloproteinase domain-containing protein 8 [Camelus ferus]